MKKKLISRKATTQLGLAVIYVMCMVLNGHDFVNVETAKWQKNGNSKVGKDLK